jgi:hypothetical protein
MLASFDGACCACSRPSVALFAKPSVQLPDGVRWHWEERATPGPGRRACRGGYSALSAAGLLAALLARRTRYAPPKGPAAAVRLGACAALAGAGLALLLAQRAAAHRVPFAAAGLGALWTRCWPPRRIGAACAGVLLLAAGLLAAARTGPGRARIVLAAPLPEDGALLALGAGAWRPAGACAGAGRAAGRRRGVESLPAAAGRRRAGWRCCCRWAGATRPACSTCSRWNSPSWRWPPSAPTAWRSAWAGQPGAAAAPCCAGCAWRARPAVHGAAGGGAGAGRRLFAADPAAGLGRRDGAGLALRRAAAGAAVRPGGAPPAAAAAAGACAARARPSRAAGVSMPTASWSGSTRPRIRTPASNCCWARGDRRRRLVRRRHASAWRAGPGAPARCCASPPCRTISRPPSS